MKEKEEENNSEEIIISTSSKKENKDKIFEEIKDNYTIENIKFINKSNISKIYEAKNITESKKVYLKIIELKNLEYNHEYFMEQIKREEEILKLCKSDNIINLNKKIETKNYILFEFEYCGKDLSTYIKTKPILKRNKYLLYHILIQISNSLKVLQEKGVMHRDIKPSNIFIDEDSFKIKLGGFGCSTYIKNNTYEQLGSIFYTAPEIIKGIKYDEKCDLWSLGITLYELYFGESPYGKNVSLSLIKNIIYKEENIYSKKSSVPEIDELFTKLLTINRNNRMNFKEFFSLVNRIKENIKYDKIYNSFASYGLFIPYSKEKQEKYDYNLATQSIPLDLIEKNNKMNLKEKNKINEIYLNYDIFECFNDKKEEILIEDKEDKEEEVMNKIVNIIDEQKIPDIMSVSQEPISFLEKPKFNNIIYYDENPTYINSVHMDSDYFDKKTSGAFILCRKLDSLNLIKKEIIKINSKDNKIVFNLIVTGSKCEKIMKYLDKDNIFNNCIKNICIYCMKPEKYQYLKEKYPKNDIYDKRKDVVNFIKKNSSEDINPFPIIKLITYEEYVKVYKERHKKISEFYGDLNPCTYQEQIRDIKDFIESEHNDNKLIQKDPDKLYKSFLTFDINEDVKHLENMDNPNDNTNYLEILDQKVIKEYTRNTFYMDMNNWLLKLKDEYYYESIAYFTARLMYSLNSYAEGQNKFFKEDNKILYRGAKIPYSCLLQYERARGKIIILTSFTSTSEDKAKALKFSERTNSKEIYTTHLNFSVLYIIKNRWENDSISNCIDIQNISRFENEREILFQPFSFYYVEKVDIDLSKYTADIYLETMKKSEIFENKLREGKEIFYDGKDNIMKFKN